MAGSIEHCQWCLEPRLALEPVQGTSSHRACYLYPQVLGQSKPWSKKMHFFFSLQSMCEHLHNSLYTLIMCLYVVCGREFILCDVILCEKSLFLYILALLHGLPCGPGKAQCFWGVHDAYLKQLFKRCKPAGFVGTGRVQCHFYEQWLASIIGCDWSAGQFILKLMILKKKKKKKLGYV